jgi:hypothetical protein
MPTLHQLTNEQAALLDVLQETEDPEDFAGALDDIGGEIEDKLESYWYVLKEIEATIAAQKEEEQRMARRRKVNENKVNYLLARIKPAVADRPDRKLTRPLFTMSVQDNPPSVEVLDYDAIPHQYKRASVILDWGEVIALSLEDRAKNLEVAKSAILKDFKGTEEDAQKFGVIISRGTSLRIK